MMDVFQMKDFLFGDMFVVIVGPVVSRRNAPVTDTTKGKMSERKRKSCFNVWH